MKTRVKLAAAAAAVLVSMGSLAQTATITWNTAQNFSGASDILTTDKVVTATAFDQGAPGATVNGVTFTTATAGAWDDGRGAYLLTGINLSLYERAGASAVETSTGDAGYNELLSRFSYTDWTGTNATLGITLNGLTSGHNYAIQVFSRGNDLNGSCALRLTSGTNVVELNNQFVTGSFTADASTLSLTYGGNGAYDAINAILVRDVTPTASAPRPGAGSRRIP